MQSRSAPPSRVGPSGARHFRAYDRRPIRLPVHLVLGFPGGASHAPGRQNAERPAVLVDISVAGAGLETDEHLRPGDQLWVSVATPTMWDPLVVPAVVAWARPSGHVMSPARAGVAFEYERPDALLAVFEMLAALRYD